MPTFNLDSLDFEDDEETRFGADDHFAARFSSGNTRFELEDLTNSAVGYIPQNISTDLIGGKFAETVSEGKALADDGNVYDTIQAAQDAASSWVKVGPGDFRESVTIDTAGLTLEGSGERTKVKFAGNDRKIYVNNNNITVNSFSIENSSSNSSVVYVDPAGSNTTLSNLSVNGTDQSGIQCNGFDSLIINCTVSNASPRCINADAEQNIVTQCYVSDGESGINIGESDSIVSFNVVENSQDEGINSFDDSIIIGNMIQNTDSFGILIGSADANSIIANNRLVNTAGIDDDGTGTELDGNLVT